MDGLHHFFLLLFLLQFKFALNYRWLGEVKLAPRSRGFREQFRRFRKFLNEFGSVRMHSDVLGCVRMQLDAWRCFRVGHFWESPELVLRIFWDNLGPEGVLFGGSYVQGVYFFRDVLLGACITSVNSSTKRLWPRLRLPRQH